MAYLDNHVYDFGLITLSQGSLELHICSSEPSDYGSVATVSLGKNTAPTVSEPDSNSSGRFVALQSSNPSYVTTTGTATHWALIDTEAERLLAATILTSSESLTEGDVFELSEAKITIPGVD